MPSLLIVVEGEGEEKAAPALVSRLLADRGHYDWYVDGNGRRKGALPAFRKSLARNLAFLRIKNPGAVLLLFDLDDGCPKQEAHALASEIRKEQLPFPVAVVLAHREYEAWVLASIETVCTDEPSLADDLTYDGDPETRRNAKGWLTDQMPYGTAYKPNLDQARFTGRIDFDLAHERSRSFRRLCNALDQLVERAGEAGVVTPE
ncbi:MAG: DUF4276 family protein [Bacteroidota bacterium]